MRKIYCLMLITLFSSFIHAPSYFTGKIVYQHTFTDLDGKETMNALYTALGREQHYLIDDKNYKALNENGRYIQLYNGQTNTYYHFSSNAAHKIDAATSSSSPAVITKHQGKEKIAGFDCQALQMETGSITTIYYYSDKIKVDPATYARHHFGDWNKYMEASNGALPLKFVMKDHKNKFIWTSVAKVVNEQKMSTEDFRFPAGYQLK